MLEATIEAVADGGYGALSIDDVASRAGVHKTTVYRRWPTREALVLDALLDRSADQVAIPDTGTFAGDLRALLDAVVANITSRAGRAILLTLCAEAPHSDALGALRHDFWSARFEVSAVIVERAIARGELSPTTDSKWVIEQAIAPLFLRTLVTGDAVDEALVAALVERAVRS